MNRVEKESNQRVIEVTDELQKTKEEVISILDERLKENTINLEERLTVITEKCEERIKEESNVKDVANKENVETKGDDKLEELRKELIERIETLEKQLINTPKDNKEEIEHMTAKLKEDIKGRKDIPQLPGKLQDDTAVELYARYLVLNNDLDAFKQLVVKGYKNAEKEIALSRRCASYNARITALEDNKRITETELKNLITKSNETQENTKTIPQLEDNKSLNTTNKLPEEKVINKESKVPDISGIEQSGDLALKFDYLIKAFNNLELTKVDKTTFEEYQKELKDKLKELTVETALKYNMQLEAEDNKTRGDITEMKGKVS
jgi:hypothetical protein